jgi:hypothetical protein
MASTTTSGDQEYIDRLRRSGLSEPEKRAAAAGLLSETDEAVAEASGFLQKTLELRLEGRKGSRDPHRLLADFVSARSEFEATVKAALDLIRGEP